MPSYIMNDDGTVTRYDEFVELRTTQPDRLGIAQVGATTPPPALDTGELVELQRCPHCQKLFRTERLPKHIQLQHTPTDNHARPRTLSEQSQSLINNVYPYRSMVRCSICGHHVNRKRLSSHMGKVHSTPNHAKQRSTQSSKVRDSVSGRAVPAPAPVPVTRTNRPQTTCPVCRVAVRTDRLERHLKKVHPPFAVPTSRPGIPEPGRGPTFPARAGSPARRVTHRTSSSPMPREEFLQSQYEPRYGGKYLGHMRRDLNGTFGSVPLYDDYGDESSAD